jgi:hypothetical protein
MAMIGGSGAGTGSGEGNDGECEASTHHERGHTST